MKSIVNVAAHRAVSNAEAGEQSSGQGRGAHQSIRLYRLPDVLARIPVSKSSWFAGIQKGLYPRGHNLGPRTTVWRSDDIDQLIATVTQVESTWQGVI